MMVTQENQMVLNIYKEAILLENIAMLKTNSKIASNKRKRTDQAVEDAE